MIEIAIYIFLSVFLFVILGYGITSLIVPKRLEEYTLWLAPWFLFIFLIIVLVICSQLGFTVAQITPLLTIGLLGMSFYSWFIKKKRVAIEFKQDGLLLIFTIMSIVLNISPLIKRYGFLTTVSMGNNDIITYATTAEYLIHHSLLESYYTDVILTITNLLHDGYRMGPSILESFFLYLLNLQGYQYSYLLQVFLYAFSIPLAYILLTLFYKKSIGALIFLMTVSVFNANLLYMLYHNFFGQVIYSGLGLFIVILFVSYFQNLEKYKSVAVSNYDLIISSAITVLYFSYHEGVIFIIFPLFIYLIFTIFKKQESLIYLKVIIKIAFISFLLGSVSIVNAIRFDFQQAFAGNPNQPIGWQLFRNNLPFANPFEMVGYLSIHNFEPLALPIAIILSSITVLLFLYGLMVSKKKEILISYMILFIIFLWWMGPGIKNFYAYNRAVTYTLPFILVVYTIGISQLSGKNKLFKIIFYSSLVLVIFSGLKLNKRFIRENFAVEKKYISLKQFPKNINEPVYIEGHVNKHVHPWQSNWEGYFMYPFIIDFRIPTKFIEDEYMLKVPDNSLMLIAKSVPGITQTKIILKNIVWENEHFFLGRICNTDSCLIDYQSGLSTVEIGKSPYEDSLLISGWSANEGEIRWSDSLNSTLRLVRNSERNTSSLAITARAIAEPQTLTVYVNEEIIGKQALNTEWNTYEFPLTTDDDVFKIKFKYSNIYKPSKLFGTADQRDLTVGFKKIWLK